MSDTHALLPGVVAGLWDSFTGWSDDRSLMEISGEDILVQERRYCRLSRSKQTQVGRHVRESHLVGSHSEADQVQVATSDIAAAARRRMWMWMVFTSGDLKVFVAVN